MLEQLLDWCRILLAGVLVVLCILLLWAVVSPIGLGARWVLEWIGFTRFREWIRAHLFLVNPMLWWRRVYEGIADAFVPETGAQSVRIAVDGRLDRLQRSMRSTVTAFRKACQNLEGLGGAKGPASVVADVKALQKRTEAVAKLGGEIPEDLVEEYKGRARAMSTMITLIVFGLAFAAVNGTLLNMFFRDVIAVRIGPVPMSLLLSIGFIVGEMALGFGVAWFLHRRMRIIAGCLVAMIVLAALFEAVIFGIVSYGFELEIPIFDEHPWMRLWMAPLGLIFVTATAIVGFIFHRTKDELDDHNGAARLRREIDTVNAYVRGLPARWDAIGAKARNAEGAISSFLDALGAKAGTLKGAVDTVQSERGMMIAALAGARVEDWPQWLEGGEGDVRLASAQNVGLGLFALTIVVNFAWFLHAAVETAAGAGFPMWANWAIALFISAVYVGIGFVALSRSQLVAANPNKVFPLRGGVPELAAAAVGAVLASIAVVWICIDAFGGDGLKWAAALLAAGAVLSFAGYCMERVIRGWGLLIRLVLGVVLAALAVVAAVVLHVVGWPFWFLCWLFFAVVSLVALPLERLIWWLQRRREAKAARVPEKTA